jgi:sulfur relay (sulfurtransferase) DsrF/TusC family protein
MDSLLVILRNPPYGTVNAAEAVRHAGGASGFDYKSILYLIDAGVLTAKKGQDAADTGFSGLGESLELLSDEMEVYVCQNSLKEHGLREDDLVEGVTADDGTMLDHALKSAQTVMIY